jgi:membrane-bound lytic murein transglycosylase F
MTYFGIDETSSEEEQIVAGIKYLYKIARAFDNITDKKEKYHFVAASYNAGRGHILDAQRLCEKNQQNSTQWKFVSKYLILKSKKEYYSDPVVKSGFLPGKHTVKYAEEVMARYNAYLELHP